jgi:hypothetical protein
MMNQVKSYRQKRCLLVAKLSKFMHGDIAIFNDTSEHRAVVTAWENCGWANGWL